MISQAKREDIIGQLEDLQNSPKASQEELDAMRRAKDSLMRILK